MNSKEAYIKLANVFKNSLEDNNKLASLRSKLKIHVYKHLSNELGDYPSRLTKAQKTSILIKKNYN